MILLNWLIPVAHAAADADIVAGVTQLATTTKENLTGTITAVLPYVAIIAAFLIGIYLVMRLFKRASK